MECNQQKIAANVEQTQSEPKQPSAVVAPNTLGMQTTRALPAAIGGTQRGGESDGQAMSTNVSAVHELNDNAQKDEDDGDEIVLDDMEIDNDSNVRTRGHDEKNACEDAGMGSDDRSDAESDDIVLVDMPTTTGVHCPVSV